MSANTVTQYFYDTKIGVMWANEGYTNMAPSFNDSKFKAYKGATMPITFEVRDRDRKPVNLLGKRVYFNAMNRLTGETLIQHRELEILDPIKARAVLRLSIIDTSDWVPGIYLYSLVLEREDGELNVLYQDTVQGAAGQFELIEGVLPKMSVTQENTKWTPVSQDMNGMQVKWFGTPFHGDATTGTSGGLHTLAIYGTGFTGKVFIEGCSNLSPSDSEHDWAAIPLENEMSPLIFRDFTGVMPFNFFGYFRWVRVSWMRENGQLGTIDRALLKN